MARASDLEKMSYGELSALRDDIDVHMRAKQSSERAALKAKIAELARSSGFDLNDLMGNGRKGKGTVAVKYRDPKNPENTWTGRGRMPRWMAAATKGNKARKDDFLV
jgi:DNA-binding protein H-NS